MKILVFVVFAFLARVVHLATIYPYTYNIVLTNRPCTTSLIENRDVSFDKVYSTLKSSIETKIGTLYRTQVGDSNFFSVVVSKFSCSNKNTVKVVVVVSLNTQQAASAVKKILQDDIANSDLSGIAVQTTVSDGSVQSYLPAVRNSVETELPNAIACDSKLYEDFRSKLVAKLLVVDDVNGLTNPSKEQVVIVSHACADTMLRYQHAKFDFYVSKENEAYTPDSSLTVLAYKVINQMTYEGSTWKLGFAYHKNIDDITLHGADDGHDGLSDVEIIFLGFGIVCAVLLAIIIIILVAKACCSCCDDNVGVLEAGEEKPLYSVVSKENNTVGHENNAYEVTGFNHPPPDYENDKEKKTPYHEIAVDVELTKTNGSTNAPPLASTPPPVAVRTKSSASSSSGSDSDNDDDEEALGLDELSERLNDEEALANEFNSLPSRVPTVKAYSERHSLKNREPTMFPCLHPTFLRGRQDIGLMLNVSMKTFIHPNFMSQNVGTHKRVLLTKSGEEGDKGADYINASFVKNTNKQVTYVSTQAPMDETVADFWQMIWEQNTTVVVMGTPLNHRGEEKCVQYWPTDKLEDRVFGKFTVTLESKNLIPDYVVTQVFVTDGNEKRQVTIYRFMSWPTHGLPSSQELVKSLINFLLDVRGHVKKDSTMPIFHGSTSRGFGAVLLCILNAMDKYDVSKKVSIKQVVQSLRKDQAGGVENVEQYKYIHLAVHTYAQRMEKS